MRIAMCSLLQVAITPEVTSRGINRAVMEQLVKLYRESHLGTRLPAYDGRKSLYTAGPLPFQSREFQISLLDEDDGSNQPRYELLPSVSTCALILCPYQCIDVNLAWQC
jgi:hypothetical protein